MKPENYKQCVLERGSTRMVSWIPNHFAKVSKMIKLRRDLTMGCLVGYSEWEDGWMIEKVFGPVISRKELDALGRQYKDTRKASDV